MKDLRQRAFVGLVGLVSAGLISFGIGCSSSNNGGGTGGSPGTGGAPATTGSGGSGTGTGGETTGGGGAGATLGCATSDVPASATIADFGGDAGVEATGGGLFVYPGSLASPGAGAPIPMVMDGALHITDTVAQGASAQYVGVGIYFSGNTTGSDCTDASQYTGVQFDLKGTLTGTGCTLQYSTNDSEHTAPSASDPKAGGASNSYSPQVQLASMLTAAGTTVKVAFADANLGAGSPATPIDPKKIETVQWQLTVPATTAAGDGGSAQCVLDMTVDNVKFY